MESISLATVLGREPVKIMKFLPTRKTRSSPTNQNIGTPPPGSLHKPQNQLDPLGEDTKNNGNYEPAAAKRRPQTQ